MVIGFIMHSFILVKTMKKIMMVKKTPDGRFFIYNNSDNAGVNFSSSFFYKRIVTRISMGEQDYVTIFASPKRRA